MTLPRFVPVEKFFALLASVAVACAAGWWWQQQAGLRRLQAERVTADLSGAAYTRAALPNLAAPGKPWGKPAAQSAGGGWIYELFTPPVIYYHATARTFTATPPVYLADQANLPFGLELLDVKLEPFRLQLVGYLGAPGDYIGTFVSAELSQTLLGRAGVRFAPLGLELKSFELRRVNIAAADAAPVYDVAGFAVLRDERSGGEVTLNTRAPKLTDTPLAVLRLLGEPQGKPRVLHEGDTFQQADATYRIERIQLDPPEVVVAKQTAGLPYPETRILKREPAEKSAANNSTARKTYPPPARSGLADTAPRP